LEFRQLSHFIAVAEELSFTKAARRAHIVQSGISASISSLERELGVELFHRSRNTVELTEAGRALLVEARRALAALAAARDVAEQARGILTGTLRIGVVPMLPAELRFSGPLKRMREKHPGVQLHVKELVVGHHDQLRDESVDLAIGPGHGPPGVTSIRLASYPIVLVCPANHRLADQRSVTVGALRDESFIDTPPDWMARRAADRAFADAGIERHAPIETGQVPLILDLVESGVGVALLPTMAVHASPGLRTVPLHPAIGDWELTVSFVGPEPASPAARAFLSMLITEFRDRGD
jgi:DNA-binding transcriptional LysR family regulator